MNHFLIETIWVMFAYGTTYLVGGLIAACVLAVIGFRLARRGPRLLVFAIAIAVWWIASFIAADMGYRAWQSSPNAPEEAYSDTGPILFLLLGWLPGLVALMVVHELLHRRQRYAAATPATPRTP